MNIEIIIREIQKIQEERDLYYSRSVQAESAKSMLEKQVNKQSEECEALKKLVKVLKADSDVKRNLYVSQQRVLDSQKKELSEKKTEIEAFKKSSSSMQKTIDDLHKKIELKGRILKKKRDKITSLEQECKNRDTQISTLINELAKQKSESARLSINNPAGTIVFQNTIETDQLIGIPESGSQVIHTNYK